MEISSSIAVMKLMFTGMVIMVDLTMLYLCQSPTATPWEKSNLYMLIGGSGGFVIFGMIFGMELAPTVAKTPNNYFREFARRAVAAIAVALMFGHGFSAVAARWLEVDMNVMLIPMCALLSMGGPYAIERYGKRAVDAAIDKGITKFGGREAPNKPVDQ